MQLALLSFLRSSGAEAASRPDTYPRCDLDIGADRDRAFFFFGSVAGRSAVLFIQSVTKLQVARLDLEAELTRTASFRPFRPGIFPPPRRPPVMPSVMVVTPSVWGEAMGAARAGRTKLRETRNCILTDRGSVFGWLIIVFVVGDIAKRAELDGSQRDGINAVVVLM